MNAMMIANFHQLTITTITPEEINLIKQWTERKRSEFSSDQLDLTGGPNRNTYMDGNTNKGSSADGWVSWPDEGKQSPPWDFSASHLVVRVKLAAVDVVVVAPEHRDQLSCVEGVHSD